MSNCGIIFSNICLSAAMHAVVQSVFSETAMELAYLLLDWQFSPSLQ